MTFERYICWHGESIQKVFTIEATQTEKSIFLATHHPMKMNKSSSIIGEEEIACNEEEFLTDFLASEDFAFVPVLGTSGTGKSHLIRWLSAKIPSTATRKVLLIPKLGTNLKDIIGLVLSLPELQEKKFDEYRKRLQQSSHRFSEQEAREQLLNNLAIAVGNNNRRDSRNLTKEQNYLIAHLSSFLYDPHFRQYWLKDHGIIHRLVIHILGYRQEIENIEERQEFTCDDLPLNILDHNKAGEQVRGFYGILIGYEDLQQTTVDWLNQHLDEAITKVLNLGREDLQILMREVRESLGEQGIELVLLIEDFAKLQGIDREVLEAVLARPQQAENKPLCAIRTALACTSGYFNGLIQSFDTIKQRVTFTVNLDIESVGDRSLITETDIQEFVSRYLNAVRHEEGEIIHSNGQLTNTCDRCSYRGECHAGFGEINGIGLYPFTATALRNMRQRMNPNNFNPRILLKDVLKFTLEKATEDLSANRFPSKVLREHFGRPRLSAMIQRDITQSDPVNAERRQTLLELWTDSNTLRDLTAEIHCAFTLPPLGVEVISTEIPTVPVPVESVPEPTPQISPSLTRKLEILDSWNNQGILSQDVVKDLRESLYYAIVEHIAWDTELLLEKSFAGPNGMFKQRNLLIETGRQRGKGASFAGIVLTLPLNPEDDTEFRETAIAFQATLQYNHYKHWNFPDGDRYFRIYAKYLDRWSEYLREQIDRYPRACGEIWNPIPATVELLSLTATFSGQTIATLEEAIDSLLIPSSTIENSRRGETWKTLAEFLQQQESKLREILVSRIACTKGDSREFQIIDTYQILQPLEKFRESWQPQETIPNDLNREYEAIAKVRQKVDELLLPAIEEEYDHQLDIYQKLITYFGENLKIVETITALEEAIKATRSASVPSATNLDNLQQLIKQARSTNFEQYISYIQKLQRLKENNNPYLLLSHLREDYQNGMIDLDEFIRESNRFLDNSSHQVKSELIQIGLKDEEEINTLQQDILDSLTELHELLLEIGE